MRKKSVLLLLSVFLILWGGCSLDPVIENNVDSTDSGSQTRACPSSPASKVVTVVVNRNFTYPLSSIGLGAISSGSLTMYYNDGCYKGTLRSISYRVTKAPTISGNYITFNVDVTFQGTVYLDLCAGLAASKVITQVINMNITYSVYSIGLSSIPNCGLTRGYNVTCYSGVLCSTNYRVTRAPTINGTYITFNLDVTFTGTVYRK